MADDPGCYWHGVEPIPADCYRLCGECWHAFPTAADLLAADNAVRAGFGIPPATAAEDVTFCPLCCHDW